MPVRSAVDWLSHIRVSPHWHIVRKSIRCAFPPDCLCDVRRSNGIWMQFRSAHLAEEAFGHPESKTESSMGERTDPKTSRPVISQISNTSKLLCPLQTTTAFIFPPHLECSEMRILHTDMLLIGLFHSQRLCSDEYIWLAERKAPSL